MSFLKIVLTSALASLSLFAQTPLDNTLLLKPPTDNWPSYNGDYSGRRYSTLKKINSTNINSLTLAWVNRPTVTMGGLGFGSASPLEVNGVLYYTSGHSVVAVDARTGRNVWQFDWAAVVAPRGVAINGSTVYVETRDCFLVGLNIKDGKERWHKTICDTDLNYYGSTAPLIIGNHVIVGFSGDAQDVPGMLASHDPETGELQWRWYAHPNPGEPEAKTWPNEEAMMHGGGSTWGSWTYDPQLNLLYFGTGNAQPVIAGKQREGSNLYTGCIVAINADTGKIAWYYQPTPHETHDFDNNQTPVLFDGVINGQPRKLLAQATRSGWFSVLDRTNGKVVNAGTYVPANWMKKGVLDAKGEPIPDPAKEPQYDGALVNPDQGGATNYYPPAFNPDTGLFYVDARNAYSVYYIYDVEDKVEGWGGNDRAGWSESYMLALDYKTGKPRWTHKWSGASTRSGLLTTAGNLVFTAGSSNDLVALDASTGEALWHAGLLNAVTNSPITYELDGTQYLVVIGSDTMYCFAMRAK